jgi:predicted ATPase
MIDEVHLDHDPIERADPRHSIDRVEPAGQVGRDRQAFAMIEPRQLKRAARAERLLNVPAIANIEQLGLSASVTLLAGENGSGKSTILEAIAAAIGFAEHGGELDRLGELPAVPRNVLDEHDVPLLAPVLSRTRPRNGYFLRAESFFNVAEFIDSRDRFAPDLSIYGDVPLHAQSHGESFLALAANRFGADGLYLLDEPEAALSVTGGDEEGINNAVYDDLQAVRQMRGFLDAPDRYLRQITIDPETDDD